MSRKIFDFLKQEITIWRAWCVFIVSLRHKHVLCLRRNEQSWADLSGEVVRYSDLTLCRVGFCKNQINRVLVINLFAAEIPLCSGGK